jgi:hypothetical protein
MDALLAVFVVLFGATLGVMVYQLLSAEVLREDVRRRNAALDEEARQDVVAGRPPRLRCRWIVR